MIFNNQKHYKGKTISQIIDHPLLYKKGKKWIIAGVSLLSLIGMSGTVNANHINADQINHNNGTYKETSHKSHNISNISQYSKHIQDQHMNNINKYHKNKVKFINPKTHQRIATKYLRTTFNKVKHSHIPQGYKLAHRELKHGKKLYKESHVVYIVPSNASMQFNPNQNNGTPKVPAKVKNLSNKNSSNSSQTSSSSTANKASSKSTLSSASKSTPSKANRNQNKSQSVNKGISLYPQSSGGISMYNSSASRASNGSHKSSSTGKNKNSNSASLSSNKGKARSASASQPSSQRKNNNLFTNKNNKRKYQHSNNKLVSQRTTPNSNKDNQIAQHNNDKQTSQIGGQRLHMSSAPFNQGNPTSSHASMSASPSAQSQGNHLTSNGSKPYSTPLEHGVYDGMNHQNNGGTPTQSRPQYNEGQQVYHHLEASHPQIAHKLPQTGMSSTQNLKAMMFILGALGLISLTGAVELKRHRN